MHVCTCIVKQLKHVTTKYCFFALGLDLQPEAAGFQLNNPPVLEIVNLLASLNVSSYLISILK